MTINMKAPELSRRSVLAGLGGLSFGLAIGTDGLKLIRRARKPTRLPASSSTPGCGSRRTARSPSSAPARKWARAR